MNTIPETEVRDALGEAAGVTGLTFNPATVLTRGHRVVRRRRLATAGLSVSAVAVAAVAAAQLTGGSTYRSLPPVGNQTSTGVNTPVPAPTPNSLDVTGPINESGEVVEGTDEAGKAPTYRARLTVKGEATGKVVESWTVLEGTKTVKTITRSTNPVGINEASLLLPAESGIPNLVLGYVNTGSYQSISAGLTFAPELLLGNRSSNALRKAIGSQPARFDHLFVQRFDAFDPTKVIGLSWADVDDSELTKVQQRSILLNTGRTDLSAAVLTEPDGNQWISWASDTELGVANYATNSPPQSVTGVVRLLGRPGSSNPAVASPDKLFGWVTGDDTTAVEVITTPPDTTVTSYGPAGSGRRPFLITAKQGSFTGPVKVNGSGSTQTIVVRSDVAPTP